MRASDPQTLDITLAQSGGLGERQHFIFYQDEGGLRATDEANGDLDTIYYLGIIDILTPYNAVKRMEHVWKGMRADRVRANRAFKQCVCGVADVCGCGYSIRSARSRLRSTRIGSLRS